MTSELNKEITDLLDHRDSIQQQICEKLLNSCRDAKIEREEFEVWLKKRLGRLMEALKIMRRYSKSKSKYITYIFFLKSRQTIKNKFGLGVSNGFLIIFPFSSSQTTTNTIRKSHNIYFWVIIDDL